MERHFRYNIVKILQDINGESDLIPYWIKLDLLDRNVPIIIDPLKVSDKVIEVEYGSIEVKNEDEYIWIKWTVNKN